MNPAAIIITFIDWRKWKTWWFNISLFLFQLTFMVVGAIIGKVKIPRIEDPWVGNTVNLLSDKPDKKRYVLNFNEKTDTITHGSWLRYHWLQFCHFWAVVWRAAQASHVRLVLWEAPKPPRFSVIPSVESRPWMCANFGYPTMEIQPWYNDWNDGKRFEYREPTFEPSPEFIEAMIEYAEKQVGKGYDSLQLFSFGLNFIFWLFCWPKWGKEVFSWLNLRGGREVCSSGLTADLRWADWRSGGLLIGRLNSRFFNIYDTAMVSPCLFAIDKNWKKAAQ